MRDKEFHAKVFCIFVYEMKYNTFTLSNGLRVIHQSNPSSVIYCGYEINAGSRLENSREEGLAHFCEHTTFKGTKRRKAWHILNCLENVGGDLNAYTNKEDTVYYAAVLKEHVGRAVDLLTDIVFHSTYPQKEIDKEVEVICDEIESYNDSPADLIYDEFENRIFQGHPLGHNILGTAEGVRSFRTEDALNFTKKYYRPERAVFFIYGDIDFHKVIRMLEKATSDFEDCQPYKEQRMNDAVLQDQSGVYVVDKGTHQAHVMIGNRGYAIHDKKRMPLYLLNNILGGPGMNARLNLSLREHHGLVYTVESNMVNYGDTGLWCTYFGCDSENIKRCLRLLKKELRKAMDIPLTDFQLRAAKKQIKGQIGIGCDNRENFALDFGKSFLHYGKEKDIPTLFASIDSITSEEILDVARDVINPDKMTTLIYK